MLLKQLHLLRSFSFVSMPKGGLASELMVRRSHKYLHKLYRRESPIENAQAIKKEFQLTLGERYRHGFQPEELKDADPLVRRALSLNNSTDKEIQQYRIAQAIKKYQKWPLDTGSAVVKAAVLCERVISQISHMEKNRQDTFGALTLTKLLTARRIAMFYLRRHDYQSFRWLIADYGLKEFRYHNHDYLKHKHTAATQKKRPKRIETNRGRWIL